MTNLVEHDRSQEEALRRRARAVIPGGMYGHQNAAMLPAGYPQFLERGDGCRIWDTAGNEYVDLMCSYGPIVLGHRHPKVEEAAAAQLAKADCQNAPAPCMVDLAELLVDRVSHADWAIFSKNGTDATTVALMAARSATGRSTVLMAKGAYHGAAPWCTPRPNGTTAGDRANLGYYTYNDLASVEAAADEAGDDLAAVIVSPFRHDAGYDQELADPAFAQGLRRLCDRRGAALVLDDVRCGLRMAHGGSWEPLGVEPDLSAWSKALANGYALAAVLGNDAMRDGARRLFVTGSFWFSAVSMAASIATIEAHRDEDAMGRMERAGERLRRGLDEQASAHGLTIRQTGPVQMPFLSFADDGDYQKASLFGVTTLQNGAYLHPRHNWFLSAAHGDADIDRALQATDAGFAAVAERFGRG
ncbi:MAG TPA: aminotransferase class III-fold pyridoxal phosphate-dependent enzyme [Acidimicrobiales bacterium]|nr:aminotransferase class III-fold pyridoxal phosphate-dependent enzyme [Acidimicrobiales bacterium]